ncbi:hypothetical protein WH47_12724 [Habropoda laboriosa]|uniref:Uncharacterized protein n=1 Tax=Habropoda laboriosa TaxID=597456 RepID=A0A0L7R4W5_9HYME|nr:hypothetical protein WH47_12724 [Habropoda laboriosa]
MKVFLVSKVVEMEVDICKYRKIIEKEYEDVSTQTDFVVSSSCTQTDENSCTSLVQLHESIQTVNSAISYPCLIGSCILQLPYELLIRHLRECHKDIFYEVDKWSVIFSEKWIVDTTTLPRTYEFAFFICNMGLFFFNAMIHDNGRLVVNIQYVDKDPLKKLFEYELALKNGNYYLRRFAMVVLLTLNLT